MFKILISLLLIQASAAYAQDNEADAGNIDEEIQAIEALDELNQSEEEIVDEVDDIVNTKTKGMSFDQGESDQVQDLENLEIDDTGLDINASDALIDIEQLNRANEGKFLLKEFIYNQRGRRDPFTPIVTDKTVIKQQVQAAKKVVLPALEKYRIDSFVLTSILWSVNEPKALVKDPENKMHLITKNSRIGTKNGYVAQIREGEVVVIEEEKNEEGKSLFTTQVLKMTR